ncbi:sensor histidine kinase [Candidatus Odyssella acanthamoebae]|nr:HAMP domain-containing sensor histidine kinase [Candidatus Paracaedibacter acanthamoebae]
MRDWLNKIPRPLFQPRLALATLKLSLNREVPYDLMRIFGIFGLIHTLLIYIVGINYKGVADVEIILRITNFTLFIPLVFIENWPAWLHRIKKYYWFFTITFVLPFFATFMFIFHNGSRAWFTKITVALLWMVLVTNWSMFLLCLIAGIMSGILVYGAIIDPNFSNFNLSWAELINSFWIVIIAGVFSLKRDEITRNRLDSMRSLAGAIAHEMRTPLFGIRSASTYLSQKLPNFLEKYTQTQGNDLTEKDKKSIERIIKTPEKINDITKNAFSIIDMLLTNLKGINGKLECTAYSANSIIEQALELYPLSPKERLLIHYAPASDQMIIGNKDLLIHVLFNLLKNALYHIKEDSKGEIYIWTENTADFFTIFFKDTGKGIPGNTLPFIFDPYYSSTKYGTGVGLHFCKQVVEGCGGKITCRSIKNHETIFKMELKKQHDNNPTYPEGEPSLNEI